MLNFAINLSLERSNNTFCRSKNVLQRELLLATTWLRYSRERALQNDYGAIPRYCDFDWILYLEPSPMYYDLGGGVDGRVCCCGMKPSFFSSVARNSGIASPT